MLFSWDLKNYLNITVSKQIGSYFGYSITAADVNGDGKLDLIVGAPMHTEPNNEGKYDVGRVYVLYQNDSFVSAVVYLFYSINNLRRSFVEFQLESFNTIHFIDGLNSKGRFGHAVASLKDLNQDGFEGNEKLR